MNIKLNSEMIGSLIYQIVSYIRLREILLILFIIKYIVIVTFTKTKVISLIFFNILP
jgi:hypothetical protein